MDKALSIIDPSPPHWEKIVTGGQKGPAVTLVPTWRGQKYRRKKVQFERQCKGPEYVHVSRYRA